MGTTVQAGRASWVRKRETHLWAGSGPVWPRVSRPRRTRREAASRSHERLGGTAICDACGRTILLGEKTSRFRRDEREVEVCCLCEARIVAQGFLRAA